MAAGCSTTPMRGGVLVPGLECESNLIKHFKNTIGEIDEARVRFLECQRVEDEIEAGLTYIRELAGYAKRFKREQIPGCTRPISL